MGSIYESKFLGQYISWPHVKDNLLKFKCRLFSGCLETPYTAEKRDKSPDSNRDYAEIFLRDEIGFNEKIS